MDRRTKDFPFGITEKGQFEYSLWNAFFDDNVQAILRTRKELSCIEPKMPTLEINRFLLAWPIKAYRDINALVCGMPKYWQDPLFALFYDWDPVFTADLLKALTDYKNLPESKWDIARILVEYPLAKTIVSEGFFPGHKNYQQELLSWKEIQELISAENFKQLESMSSTYRASNLKSGHFYRICKARQKILDDWNENFLADDKTVIPDDFTLLPCRPRPSFYKSSVIKTPRKK